MDRLGLRHSNDAWRRVATELWALHGWSRWARLAARIKVSVATGIFAFQRLVLGAWRLLSQPSQGRELKHGVEGPKNCCHRAQAQW